MDKGSAKFKTYKRITNLSFADTVLHTVFGLC